MKSALRILCFCTATTAAITGVSAWTVPLPPTWRRGAAAAFTAVTIATTLPSVAASSNIDFTGQYSDPVHPGCRREIIMVDRTVVRITGTDGNPGCPPDGSGTPWTLTGQVVSDNNNRDLLMVDFSPKGGPKDLSGTYDATTAPGSILWPDGNRWTLRETKTGIDLNIDPLM